ncbi:hypothetical protein MiSe_19620 [Microseira wollei NIES-4236]|uniref:Uncharacterized protein n=1 Tax=Microseira wollei NIES-4236 TaxID=2530354 RepID=A0AAV3WG53_9CYAN|nr:hypothetical protein MiSe_19620 [Microseira wollei NIES-4236]
MITFLPSLLAGLAMVERGMTPLAVGGLVPLTTSMVKLATIIFIAGLAMIPSMAGLVMTPSMAGITLSTVGMDFIPGEVMTDSMVETAMT